MRLLSAALCGGLSSLCCGLSPPNHPIGSESRLVASVAPPRELWRACCDDDSAGGATFALAMGVAPASADVVVARIVCGVLELRRLADGAVLVSSKGLAPAARSTTRVLALEPVSGAVFVAGALDKTVSSWSSHAPAAPLCSATDSQSGWVRCVARIGEGLVAAVACHEVALRFVAHDGALAASHAQLDSGPTPGDLEPWRRHDVLSLAYCAEAGLLWAGLVDGSMRVWRKSADEVFERIAAWRASDARVVDIVVVDCESCVAVDRGGGVARWRLDDRGGSPRKEAEWRHVARIECAARLDADSIVVGAADGAVVAIDAANLEERGKVQLAAAVTALAADGHRRIAVADASGALTSYCWRGSTEREGCAETRVGEE